MDEHDVDEVLQQALDRLTLLADVSSALAGTLDAQEALQRVCRILAQRMGDWCAVDLLVGEHLERVCVTHREGIPQQRAVVHEAPAVGVPRVADGPLSRVLYGAGPLLVDEDQLRGEAHATSGTVLDLPRAANSAIVAPLRARREVFGALTIARMAPHAALSGDDLALLEDLVHRVALAMDNARLHQETERIAERLQRSLLPTLPDVDHLTMAARYTPSHATAQVGGDWYDSFLLPTGDTALIIGDVTGHDLKAAVTMSQLRNTLRGIACDRREPPGAILHRLDLVQHALYPRATASCLYGVVDGPVGGPWRLHYAAAGHPPPLLVTWDGDTRFLEGGRSLLLGIDPHTARPSATEDLPARCTVLLYTDGLIERRGETLDHGMTRLRQHAGALARTDPGELCDELLAGLAPHSTDDVAVLALRLPPPGPRARSDRREDGHT
ncbi:PP2C family protein-serine/threonine phosphatase [Streptomyces sp. NPDC001348]